METNKRETSGALQPRSSFPSLGDILSEDQFDILTVFRTLWYGRYIIILCAFLATIVGAYYVFMVAKNEYSATATLEFSPEGGSFLDIEGLIPGSSIDEVGINTEIDTIKSREMISRLVAELDLVSNPDFNAALRPEPLFDLKKFLMINGALDMLDDERRKEIERRFVIVAAKESVTVSIRRDTNLFDITTRAGDPETAAEMANKLAKIYIEFRLAQVFEKADVSLKWLTERISKFEGEMQARQDAINLLKTDTNLISVEALEQLTARMKDARDRLDKRKIELTQSEFNISEIQPLRASNQIDLLAELLNDSRLTAIIEQRKTQTESADDAAVEAETWAFVDQIIAQRIADLDKKIFEFELLEKAHTTTLEEVAEQRNDLQELQQMERELRASGELFQSLLTGLQEATIRAGLIQPNSQIMSSAIAPLTPSSPRRLRILAAALFLGGLIGAILVMLREVSSNQIRSEYDLEKMFSIPTVGKINSATTVRKRNALVDFVLRQPLSSTAESVRNLRTSIMMARPNNPPKVIMITSSEPGEGKTSLSIMLAMNFADLGKRVLLIEGDIRRRAMNLHFEGDMQGGILDVVSGEKSLESAVVRDPRIEVDILLGQQGEINAADVLSSEGFHSMINDARENYDIVIIDTPPVLVVPDARIIAAVADYVLYVVRSDKTQDFKVKAGIKQIEMVGISVDGLALSQVNAKKMQRYTYGGYGHYGNYDVEP